MSDISNMSDSTTDIVILWIEDEEMEIISQEEYEDFNYEYGMIHLINYVVLGTVESYTQQYLDEMDDIINDVQEFKQSEDVQQFINHYKKIICTTNKYEIIWKFLSGKYDPINNIESDLHILSNHEEQSCIQIQRIKHFILIVDDIRIHIGSVISKLEDYYKQITDYEDNKFILYLAIDNYHCEIQESRMFKDMCMQELKYHPRHVEVMLENENGFELLGY